MQHFWQRCVSNVQNLKPDIRKRVLTDQPHLYGLQFINNHKRCERVDRWRDTGENTYVFDF